MASAESSEHSTSCSFLDLCGDAERDRVRMSWPPQSTLRASSPTKSFGRVACFPHTSASILSIKPLMHHDYQHISFISCMSSPYFICRHVM